MKYIKFIDALAALVAVIIILLLVLVLGCKLGREIEQKEAIRAGVACFIINSTNGETSFQYLKP